MIIQQIRDLQSSVDRHAASVDAKFAKMEGRVDEIDGKIDDLNSSRDRVIGAAQALSLVGGVITVVFGLIGWLAVYGVPSWIKQALK